MELLIILMPIGIIEAVIFLMMYHESKKPFFGKDEDDNGQMKGKVYE